MATAVQSLSSRSTLTDGPGGLRISIRPQSSWIGLILLVWTAWTAGGIAAGTTLLHGDNLPILLFWMCGWLFGEIALSYAILYMIGGKQVILANLSGLTIRTEIFNLSWAKTYPVQEMRNLRFRPASGVGRRRKVSGIAFNYSGKVVLFAIGMDEPEAKELIRQILLKCSVPDTPPQKSAIKF